VDSLPVVTCRFPGPYDVPMSDYVEPPDDNEPEEQPLDPEERAALRQDLVDVQVLKEVLEPKGIKGAVFYCPDCGEDHFLGWDLLAGNLQELLEAGESPVHEPAFEPNPNDYVSWDYARGFLDGYESFEQEELGEIGSRLIAKLVKSGMRIEEVKGVLAAVGLQAPDGAIERDPKRLNRNDQ
jgi:hypothetical protein